MSTQDASELPDETDVLVVGAGVAGLYCAWRLLDEGKAENVVIVERLNRTGGRLDTDLITLKDASGQVTVRDEESGMRFNYGMHELMALFGKLGLCDDIEPFPMAPDGPNDNRYFMRGSAFTQAEATADPNKWSELYQLDERERGKSPVTIINDVYTAIQKANPQEAWPANPTPADWQRFRLHFRWKGTPLNEWQLWGLLRDMGYSEECITMLSHAVGFEGPFLSLANAGEAFQILEDFPKNPQYYTFRKGYSTLPNKLRELSKGHHGGQIFLGVNVEAIHPSRDGFDVTLTVAPPGRSSSRFVEHGVTRHIRAPKVILAVATKALTHLYASSPVFHDSDRAEQISNDLQSVVNMRLMKINLYFETAWWEDETIVNPPVQIGPSFTDLPVNSVYPFYSVTTAGTSDAKSRPAALTIYCDFNNILGCAVGLENRTGPGGTVGVAGCSAVPAAMAPHEVFPPAADNGTLARMAAVAACQADRGVPDTGRGLGGAVARVLLHDVRRLQSHGRVSLLTGRRAAREQPPPRTPWVVVRSGIRAAPVQSDLPGGAGRCVENDPTP